jgi:hypothetical protein
MYRRYIIFLLIKCLQGWYLPEAAHPYYVLAPHATIDFVSPAGPNPPVDEYSVKVSSRIVIRLVLCIHRVLKTFTDPESVKFLKDETVTSKLASAKKLSEVRVEDYDAIFYMGGHGPVLDLASDPVNAKLASEVKTLSHLRPHTSYLTGSSSSGKAAKSYRPSAMEQRTNKFSYNESTF